MILELKVELLHVEQPVWRRLRIDGDMSFFELHEVLQLAFDWEDMHLHKFMVTKSRGKKVHSIIDGDDEFGTGEDEDIETVGFWLSKKGDRAVYIYDFGDDWHHEIIVEKVLRDDADIQVPYCLDAEGLAPEEDSRGALLSGEYEVEQYLSGKAIVLDLNSQFELWEDPDEDFFTDEIEEALDDLDDDDFDDEMDELIDEFFGHMTDHIHTEREFDELYETVKEFYKRAPWEDLDVDQVFYVDYGVAGVFGSVLGSSGVEFGLSVYSGPNGWLAMNELMTGRMKQEHFIYKNSGLGLMFCDREELPVDYYRQLKESRVRFHGRGKWPLLSTYDPGYVPAPLQVESAMVMKDMLKFAIKAADLAKSGKAVPYPFETHEFLCFVPNEKTGVYEDLYGDYDMLEKVEFIEEGGFKVISEEEISRLEKLPKTTTVYDLSLQFSNDPVQEKEGDRPYLPIVGLVKEQPADYFIHHTVLSHMTPEQALMQTLVDLADKLGQLPEKIWLPAEFESAVGEVMKEIGVEVVWV
ncbi:hypothetical protein KP77_27830 [Jeotgalibacillus alimentarius]|uniref:TnpR protein n=1 Tax=Jeotgalibacillus alimentarius TaxID=135826 RepID=A0A0C2VQE7_9BACL|nr:plasmid pRiA4b ORF-3 family protein [Jeotgalibacillus alimentarius]KIL46656.1 hypothetical protein KP77_27830 [Jeotgalibacillus alimentarius]